MRPLLIFDRDGVLNEVVIHPELGLVDSPLNTEQVVVPAAIPRVLAEMTAHGFGIVVVTNQPAAAKGKTTLANLEAVHAKIVAECESAGAQILKSYICFHRAEDGCDCRKPKPTMLLQAFKDFPEYPPDLAWMVGDSITDIEAAKQAGIRSAFLGSEKCDTCRILHERELLPTIRARNLEGFWKEIQPA